jgi:ABC-2 type transport system permease protein
MTDTIAVMPAPTRPAAREYPRQHFSWILRSEWMKLRTLRSNKLALALTVVGTVGVAALVCAEAAAHYDGINNQISDPTNLSLSGWYLTQLVVGVVAVLTVTSEFGSRMIRTTYAASPRRLSVLAAKLTVVVAAALVVSTACSLASYLLGQRLLHSTGLATTLSDPNVARTVLGSALYITILAVIGVALGAIVRNTAGAISTLFGLLFVPPILAEAFPTHWHNAIQNYSPLNAGTAIFNVQHVKGLGPWAGIGVLGIYAAILLSAGILLTVTRDS